MQFSRDGQRTKLIHKQRSSRNGHPPLQGKQINCSEVSSTTDQWHAGSGGGGGGGVGMAP